MIIKEELITPLLAKQLLEKNTNNRTPKKPVIARYSTDILGGRWKKNTGETIKISNTGKIIDGQHRLLAVIKANIPVSFTIAYDVEDDIMDVLDTGSKRSPADVFQIEGIKHATLIPSIISFLNSLKKGYSGANGAINLRLTNAQLLSEYYENPKHWNMIALKVSSWYEKFAKILPPSYIGAFYALFYEKDEQQAEEFMDQLCIGINVSNSAILLLRNRLIQDKVSIKKIQASNKVALILKSWNHFREGTDLKVLKYDPEKEEFPKVV